MDHNVTIEELRKVIAMEGMPDELLRWILERTELREYEDGEVLFKTGEPAVDMIMIIEGKGDFYMDVNGTLVYYVSFENDKATGGITGLIPHSRMKTSPGYAFSVGKLRLLALNKQYFPELE